MMVVRLFAPWVGGMERQALKLATELVRSGRLSVRILTGRWFAGTPRRDSIEGVDVYRHAALRAESAGRGFRRLGAYVYMASLLLHLLRTKKTYNVIHVHGLSYHTAVSRMASRVTGKPMVVKLANSGVASDIVKMRKGQHLRSARHLLGLALAGDVYIALTPAIRAELVSAGVDPSRIVEIPNGVEIPERIAPFPPLDGGLHLLFVGRLHRQKDLDTVLVAMERSRKEFPVFLDVIGDGPERARLEAEVQLLGLSSCVTFHGPTNDVTSFLRRAHALVLPSRAEGLSNALLEAMAAGRPAIVSDIPGNVSVVDDGVDGFVFSVGDPDHLAELLDRLAVDPGQLVMAGQAASRKVSETYAMARIADRYEALYERMLSEVGRRPMRKGRA